MPDTPEVPRPAPTPEVPVAVRGGSESQDSSIDRSLRSPQAVVESLEAARAAGAQIPKVLDTAVLSEQPSTYIKPGEIVGYAGAPDAEKQEREDMAWEERLPPEIHDFILREGTTADDAVAAYAGAAGLELSDEQRKDLQGKVERLQERVREAAARQAAAAGGSGEIPPVVPPTAESAPGPERNGRERDEEPSEDIHEVMRRLDRAYEEFFETEELTPELKARIDEQFADFHRLVSMRWSDDRLPGLDRQLANLGRRVGIIDLTKDELGNPIGEHHILTRMNLIGSRIYDLSRPSLAVVTQSMADLRVDVLDSREGESEADQSKREAVLEKIPEVTEQFRQLWGVNIGDALTIDQEMRILGEALSQVDPEDQRLSQLEAIIMAYPAAERTELLRQGLSQDVLRSRGVIQAEIHEMQRFFLHDPEHPDVPSSNPNPIVPDDPEAGLKVQVTNEYSRRRVAENPRGSLEELRLLRDVLARINPNHPRVIAMDGLMSAYVNHPETLLEEVRGAIEDVVVDIRAKLTGEAEEIEELTLPDTSFETLRESWDQKRTILEQLQENDAPDEQAIEAIDRELTEIERDLTRYLKVAERVGYLRRRESKVNTDFDNYMQRVNGGPGIPREDSGDLAEEIEEEANGPYAVFQAQETADLASRRLMPSRLVYEKPDGQKVVIFREELAGTIALYSRESKRSQAEYFANKVRRQEPPWRIVEGAWDWRKIENEREKARKTELWKPIWSTSYDLSNCQSMDDVIYAADDHIRFIAITEKTPEAALAKIQAFSDAIGAYAKSIPKERGGTEKISSTEINTLKIIYQDQAFALLFQTFNGEYNVPNCAAVYGKFSSMSEAMDHFEAITLLRNGLVYRANMIQKKAGYELLYRWGGLNGQLKGYMNTQIAMYGMKMGMFADDLIGEMVMDRHVTEEGVVIGGRQAIMLNMRKLGHDIPDDEMNALYVRDTASLLVAQRAGETLTEQELKALRIRGIKAKKPKDRTRQERIDYDEAREQAEAAVKTYLQLMNMFGETALRASPSYMGAAKKIDGTPAINSLEAKEAHEVPIWMSERFGMLAMNMLDWRIADHNKAIEDAIVAERQRPGGSRKSEIKKLVGGVIYRDSYLYQQLIERARDDANDAIDKNGWNAKLLDYDLTDAVAQYNESALKGKKPSKVKTESRADKELKVKLKAAFKAKKDQQGNSVLLVDTQTKRVATVISASKNVMGRSLTSTYDANQNEQHNEFTSEEVWLEALELRAGTKRPDQVSRMAVRRLIVDPSLDRIPVYRTKYVEENGMRRLVRTHIAGPDIGLAEQKGEEALILAACHGSFMRRWENRRALSIKFEKLTDFGFPNALRNGGLRRIFFPQALFAANPNRWTPRAEWMGARILTTATSLGDRNGWEDSFEQIKAIKRRSLEDREYNQEETDNPECNTAANEYMNQQRLHWAYVGTPAEGEVKAAFFEKPTAELEDIMGALGMINQFLQQTVDPITEEKFWTFKEDQRGEQARFVKDIQERLSRVKAMFDPLFKNISEATASTGAMDLRGTDFYRFSETDGIKRRVNLRNVFEPMSGPEGKQTRKPLSDIGRSRQLTRMVAEDILTYLTNAILESADPNKPYAGALKEYQDQSQWLRLLKTLRLNTSVISQLDPDAAEYLEPGRTYVTLWDFLIGKWARR
ncbi:hypothetical protein HY405_02350 [Candidatus Microgenomates bacterium]|nr:hypothetical protein [Candidatus Microgenomates bacterium]